MKNKITNLILTVLLSGILSLPVAAITLDTADADYSSSVQVSLGIGDVALSSYVWQFSSNEYIYGYTVANASSTPISFFSVAIQSGGRAWNASHNSDPLGINPVSEQVITSGGCAKSVNYMFNSLDQNRISSLVFFESDQRPCMAPASIFGTLAGIPYFNSKGMVYSPDAPEPATILLLGSGITAILLKRKRK